MREKVIAIKLDAIAWELIEAEAEVLGQPEWEYLSNLLSAILRAQGLDIHPPYPQQITITDNSNGTHT